MALNGMNESTMEQVQHHSGQSVTPLFIKRSQRPESAATGSEKPTMAELSSLTSLEEVLEKQWEMGAQYFMEQAQHFDIASLLSCLHKLKRENVELEDKLEYMLRRRNNLLAVNARLVSPLGGYPVKNEYQASSSNQQEQQQSHRPHQS